jgi:phosphoribosylamine--glycine ligase
MRVMVLGNGAREHALAWRLDRDAEVDEVLCAPGNGGTSRIARSLPLDPSRPDQVLDAARRERVGLVVVGPEAPLVAGVVDALGAAGIPTFGPTAAAARLEGSKAFAKELMGKKGVPTADFAVFDDPDAAEAHCRARAGGMVVKADGLAAGKGVVVADGADEGVAAVRWIMRDRAHGEAGARVIIEDRLEGEEVSFHVVCDGQRTVPLVAAQDHKRIGEGDTGPNTGGMGAYSPPGFAGAAFERRVMREVVEPVLEGMAEAGTPFRGVLFVGLMVDSGGTPRVLEFNTRFGDPECQCLVARFQGSLSTLLLAAATGELRDASAHWSAPASLCVVLAAAGYPGPVDKGQPITGIPEASALPDVAVFHAGTRKDADGTIRTAGGRVLSVTGWGPNIDVAAERAYRAADRIDFPGKQMRRDIGWRARSGAPGPAGLPLLGDAAPSRGGRGGDHGDHDDDEDPEDARYRIE